MLLVWQWAAGHPFWVDEEMLALNLRGRSFGGLAAPLWLNQSAPLGWLALERLALLAFGTGERALRLLPLLFDIGTLACAAWIGRRWLSIAGAAVLALLCAFGPWLAYHALELKPYSSDAFWALLLSGLAAWVLEPEVRGEAPASPPANLEVRATPVDATADDRPRTVRRVLTWWAAAAVGHWFGNGALLVTPACALVLHAVLWRRHGSRMAGMAAVGALGWLASFGVHYELAISHTAASASLHRYWSFAMAPASGGLPGAVEWAMTRLEPLAEKPVGTTHPLSFWLVVAAGIGLAIRSRPAPGLLLALIPLSAFVFGALRLVPVYERLSLWIVPALYVGVAAAVEGVVSAGLSAVARRRVLPAILAAAAAIPTGLVAFDITRSGVAFLTARPTDDYHQLDDRSAVRWLMKQRRAGDVVLTTRLALPAIWWYGGDSWTPDGALRAGEADIPVFEAIAVPGGTRCAPSLAAQLGHPPRVLLYLGFRMDDWPHAREDLLLTRLAEIGAITQFRPFAGMGGSMIVDLQQPPSPGPQLPPRPWVRAPAASPVAPGCIAARPARAW